MKISGRDVSAALDGPLGWIAVAGVALVVIYVLYEKAASETDLLSAQAQGNLQAFKCSPLSFLGNLVSGGC